MTACAQAVDELAAHGLIAMVEPFMSSRVNGKVRNDLSPDAVIKSVAHRPGPRRDVGLHLDEAARGRPRWTG